MSGRRTFATVGVLGVGATMLLAACGTAASASPVWCEAIGALDAAIATVEPSDPDAVRATFAGLDETATTIAERAPDEVRAAAGDVAGAITGAADTGSPTFFDPDVATSMAAVHAFAGEDCRYERLVITAVDYAFEGVPAELDAGKLAVVFENASDVEDHEVVVFRKAAGVESAMVELLGLPEEEAMTKAFPVAFAAAGAGERNGLILDLDPGDYALVCFIPIGSEDGPPHFTEGMVVDLRVG